MERMPVACLRFCCEMFICHVLQSGQFNEDMIPTVGFNMRKVTKGNVTIKVSGNGLQILCRPNVT